MTLLEELIIATAKPSFKESEYFLREELWCNHDILELIAESFDVCILVFDRTFEKPGFIVKDIYIKAGRRCKDILPITQHENSFNYLSSLDTNCIGSNTVSLKER
jgi:hypothetical protein